MELRATAHHLGSIVAAGGHGSGSDDSSSDSGMGNLTGYGIHGVAGRGGGGGGAWGEGESDEDGEWGVEYAWSAQGGAGRYQAPTLVNRMPQAICNNYLRVRREKCGCFCVEGARGRALLQGVFGWLFRGSTGRVVDVVLFGLSSVGSCVLPTLACAWFWR